MAPKQPIDSRIVSIFSDHNIAEPFNISQISQKIGAAYPHTYNAVTELIEDGILIASSIGKSRYCRLNLENDQARNLLEGSFIQKKYSQKSHNLQNLNNEIKRLALLEPAIIAALLYKNALYIIISDKTKSQKILQNTAILNIVFLTPQKLQDSLLTSLDILDGLVLFGAERLLLLIQPIQEQLTLNHSSLFRGVRC